MLCQTYLKLLSFWAFFTILILSGQGELAVEYPRARLTTGGRTWNSYSLRGADEFVLEQCKYRRNLTYVDAGSNYPLVGSNTASLDRDFGWRGWCIDANQEKLKQYAGARTCKTLHAIIAGRSGIYSNFHAGNSVYDHQDYTMTLGQLLREAKVPRRVDYLSLCIHGLETDVLNSWLLMDFDFGVVSVCNPTFEADKLLAKYSYSYERGVDAVGERGPPYKEAFYTRAPRIAPHNLTRSINRAIQRALPSYAQKLRRPGRRTN